MKSHLSPLSEHNNFTRLQNQADYITKTPAFCLLAVHGDRQRAQDVDNAVTTVTALFSASQIDSFASICSKFECHKYVIL